MNAITTLDFTILNYIHTHLTCPALDFIMPYITTLGNAGIFWILLTVVFILIPSKRRVGITMAVALIIDVVVCNGILKPVVARIRPYEINTSIQLLIKAPTDFSFPSGHSAASFAAVSAMTFRKDKTSWIFLILAILICFSRLYLYVHYPSDVLAGIIVGIIAGLLAFIFCKKFLDQRIARFLEK